MCCHNGAIDMKFLNTINQGYYNWLLLFGCTLFCSKITRLASARQMIIWFSAGYDVIRTQFTEAIKTHSWAFVYIRLYCYFRALAELFYGNNLAYIFLKFIVWTGQTKADSLMLYMFKRNTS